MDCHDIPVEQGVSEAQEGIETVLRRTPIPSGKSEAGVQVIPKEPRKSREIVAPGLTFMPS
jgi:hypothetical protein